MAHTYVITSITRDSADNTVITGTVDGIPVTINCWWSAIAQKANTAAVQAFLAPLMLAQAFPSIPTPVTIYNGTFNQ